MKNTDKLSEVFFDRAKGDFSNVKPRKPSVSDDPRYVYSAGCTFHGPIAQVGKTGGGMSLPCCPSCGSMLFEMESQEKWDAQIADYAKKKDDPRYGAFMAWFGALRPCRPFRTQAEFDALRAEFNALEAATP